MTLVFTSCCSCKYDIRSNSRRGAKGKTLSRKSKRRVWSEYPGMLLGKQAFTIFSVNPLVFEHVTKWPIMQIAPVVHTTKEKGIGNYELACNIGMRFQCGCLDAGHEGEYACVSYVSLFQEVFLLRRVFWTFFHQLFLIVNTWWNSLLKRLRQC